MFPAMLAGLGAAGLSGGMDILGGFLQGQANSAEAAKSREFIRNMYKKRYQMTMEDMRLAGLNPMLAYSQGGGGVPAGPMAQHPNMMSGAAATARGVAKNVEEIASLRSQRKITDSQADVMENEKERSRHGVFTEMWDSALKRQQTDESSARTEREKATSENIRQQTRIGVSAEAMAELDAAFYKSDPGQVMRILERIMPSAGALGRLLPRGPQGDRKVLHEHRRKP